jgi:hypothetical protein
MALFPFRRRVAATASPDLRSQLIGVIARKNLPSLTALVRAQRETICAEFEDWTTIPMHMKDDPQLLEHYGEMLLSVARIIEHDGDPSLIRMLEGDPADAPVEAWNEQMAIAAALSGQARFAEAAQVLSALADRLATLRGSAVDFYRPRVLGKLGIALYQSGDIGRGRDLTAQARDICRQLGDEDGVQAYEANLQNMS